MIKGEMDYQVSQQHLCDGVAIGLDSCVRVHRFEYHQPHLGRVFSGFPSRWGGGGGGGEGFK